MSTNIFIPAEDLAEKSQQYYQSLEDKIINGTTDETGQKVYGIKDSYFGVIDENDLIVLKGWQTSMQEIAEAGNNKFNFTFISPVNFSLMPATEIFDIIKKWFEKQETENQAQQQYKLIYVTADRWSAIIMRIEWELEADNSFTQELMERISVYHNEVKIAYENSFNEAFGKETDIVGVAWHPTILADASNGRNQTSLSYNLNQQIMEDGKEEPDLNTIKNLLVNWWQKKDNDFVISFPEIEALNNSEQPELLLFTVSWNK